MSEAEIEKMAQYYVEAAWAHGLETAHAIWLEMCAVEYPEDLPDPERVVMDIFKRHGVEVERYDRGQP
jgi:hypothetical protein